MDKQTLAVMIPLLALCIPVFAIFFKGLAKVLKARGQEPHAAPHLQAQVDELRESLEQVRRELAEAKREAGLHRAAADPGSGARSPARASQLNPPDAIGLAGRKGSPPNTAPDVSSSRCVLYTWIFDSGPGAEARGLLCQALLRSCNPLST